MKKHRKLENSVSLGKETQINIESLKKGILSSVEQEGDQYILFTFDNGEKFLMIHDQECCEEVYIEDVCGDWDDLIGVPLLMSEEVSKESDSSGGFDWTFYKFATIKGSVTVRWCGTSESGYYSTKAFMYKVVYLEYEDYPYPKKRGR